MTPAAPLYNGVLNPPLGPVPVPPTSELEATLGRMVAPNMGSGGEGKPAGVASATPLKNVPVAVIESGVPVVNSRPVENRPGPLANGGPEVEETVYVTALARADGKPTTNSANTAKRRSGITGSFAKCELERSKWGE